MKKLLTVLCAACLMLLACGLTACGREKQYKLTVVGSEYLYEGLNDTYKAGEIVSIKAKLTANENVRANLDGVLLAKTKSSQNDYWLFTFEMPAADTVLTIDSVKQFGEELLVGFCLKFYDKNNNAIAEFDEDFQSPEAFANYAYCYFDEIYGENVFNSNDNADVFADGKINVSRTLGLCIFNVDLENTLYFTNEFLGSSVSVDWVYINDITTELSTKKGDKRIFEKSEFIVSNNQNISDDRFDVNGEQYEAKFDSLITVKFKYIDHLTVVNVVEYDKDDNKIKTYKISGENRIERYEVSPDCDYVVVEEEYGANGEEAHVERTLIEKNNNINKTLKFPRGNGLILPVSLFFEW